MRVRKAALATLAVLMAAASAGEAQDALDSAVTRARQAWLQHDMERLVAGSDTMRLNIPGTAAPSLKPGQAARLLDRYVHSAQERGLQLVGVRRLADDHAYAELARAYVVKGTSEEQRERVFLGFRQLDGSWRLREVRITP